MRPLLEVQGRICGFLAENAEGEQEEEVKSRGAFSLSLSLPLWDMQEKFLLVVAYPPGRSL